MSKQKVVYMEKDGVRTEVTQAQFKGLAKRGWTVVDDGDKELKQQQDAEAKQTAELEEQEQKLFGTDDEE